MVAIPRADDDDLTSLILKWLIHKMTMTSLALLSMASVTDAML